MRITAGLHPTDTILWPKVKTFVSDYPDINVEISVDYGLTDIAAQRFDAGVRLGESVAKDMVAVRIGPDFAMAVVASPAYFAKRRAPKAPQDLTDHNCINLRMPTYGGLYAWEFEKGARELRVRVEGQLTFNASDQILKAALAGCGVGYLPEDTVAPHLKQGRLERVLCRLVSAFLRLSPLLPAQQAGIASTFIARVRVALQGLSRRQRRIRLHP